MIREIAGGTVARGILDAWPGRERYKPVVFASREKVRRILGVEFGDTRVTSTLESLGFSVEVDRSGYAVDVPYWRPDVTVAEDVAEELARIIGYDTIPISVIAAPIPKWEPSPERDLRERVRDALAASGLQETISYPLTTSEALARIQPRAKLPEPLHVVNPLTSEHAVLRTALRASVLQTLVRNTRTWRGPVALFEVGRVYLDRGEGLPEERETAAGVLAGVGSEPSWKAETGEFDFYDAKGVVEEVLLALGVAGDFEPVDDATFAAGRCASISVHGARVGVVGELATEVLEAFDCDISPVAMFEFDLPALGEAAGADAYTPTAYRPFPRFPESIHDLAIVVDEPVPAARILKIVEHNRLVRRVDVFDVYHGAGGPEGRKSLALRVVYQSGNRTLTAEDVTKEEGSILKVLKREVGAVLRA
jgi:phenylalanyl-tRNA synthetase beta chain